MEFDFESYTFQQLSAQSPDHLTHSWDPSKLENLCPACCNFGAEEPDKTIFVSVDGNMQLRRFKDTKEKSPTFQEFEEFPTALFVAKNRRFYGNATEDNPEDNEQPLGLDNSKSPTLSCDSQFRATRGWETKSGSTRELRSLDLFDETGVMGMVCRHGCPLRYLNIYTGERARHAITLLKTLQQLRPDITRIRCCYDIACIFSTTVQVCMALNISI